MDHIDCDKCGKRKSPPFDNPTDNCQCIDPLFYHEGIIKETNTRLANIEIKLASQLSRVEGAILGLTDALNLIFKDKK